MQITYRRTGGVLALVTFAVIAMAAVVITVVVAAVLLVATLTIAAAVLLMRAVLPRAWRHRFGGRTASRMSSAADAMPFGESSRHRTIEATVVKSTASRDERDLRRLDSDKG